MGHTRKEKKIFFNFTSEKIFTLRAEKSDWWPI